MLRTNQNLKLTDVNRLKHVLYSIISSGYTTWESSIHSFFERTAANFSKNSGNIFTFQLIDLAGSLTKDISGLEAKNYSLIIEEF